MLTLTENAATAVKDIVDRAPDSDATGLRIHGADDPRGGLALAVSSAEPTDEVVELSGARVFLDPVASVALDDRVLDARIDEGGAVQFELATKS